MIQLGRFIVLKGVGNLGSTEKVEQKPVLARVLHEKWNVKIISHNCILNQNTW